MTGLLDRILDSKREHVRELRGQRLPTPPPRRPVALKRGPGQPLHLLAEIKRRSPSAGELSTRLSVAERAARYSEEGVALISVLTDTPFFGGSYRDLETARATSQSPLLCKDFIIDETQLDAARAWGADAALLIVRCLEMTVLRRLILAARARDLVPVVEVTTATEATAALEAGAEVVGVNARDLDTLTMNRARATKVLHALPEPIVALHLSGLASPEDVTEVATSRADGALVGEALMRQDDPRALLRAMLQAAGAARAAQTL